MVQNTANIGSGNGLVPSGDIEPYPCHDMVSLGHSGSNLNVNPKSNI